MGSNQAIVIPEAVVDIVQEVVERLYLHNPQWPSEMVVAIWGNFSEETTAERTVAMTISAKIAEQFELRLRT